MMVLLANGHIWVAPSGGRGAHDLLPLEPPFQPAAAPLTCGAAATSSRTSSACLMCHPDGKS
jgi:hypothetical protein